MASQNALGDRGAFNLSGDSASFQSKKSDIFGSFDDIEKSYQSKLAVRSESELKRERDSINSSDVSNEGCNIDNDDGFKRPRSPKRPQRSALSRRRDFRSKAWSRREDYNQGKKPDFEKNPTNWKKYSLEDTSVCGNAQNSTVAFDLIRQLKERREKDETGLGEGMEKAGWDQKMVFSKPEGSERGMGKPADCEDVHRMQEYDFGAKSPRKKAKIVKQDSNAMEVSSSVPLALHHIEAERNEYSDTSNQSDVSFQKVSQSESLEVEDVVTSSGQEMKEKVGQDIPETVGFKKRKWKRNVRSRQDDDE